MNGDFIVDRLDLPVTLYTSPFQGAENFIE